MKLPTIAIVLALSIVPNLQAQSLDIGGISVRLGEPVTNALTKLRTAYEVEYAENSKRWFVKRRDGVRVFWLGNLQVAGERVASVEKGYVFESDDSKLGEAYGLALRDARRLGGSNCKTLLQEWSDGGVKSVNSVCGLYTVVFTLPFSTAPEGGGGLVATGISIRLGDEVR